MQIVRFTLTISLSLAGCGGSSDLDGGLIEVDAGPSADAGSVVGMDAGRDGGGGPEDAGRPDAGPDPYDAEALYEQVAQAICDQARRCASRDSVEPVEYCHPTYVDVVWDDMLEAWRQGRAEVDETAAAACIEAARTLDCFEQPLGLCLDAIVGTVPEDGACGLGNFASFSAECAPDLVCITEEMCPGRCAPAAAPGEACDATRPCARGSSCQAGTCVVGPGLGDSCSTTLICAAGTTCDAGTCVPLLGAGDACTTSAECARGLRCIDDGAGTDRCAVPDLGQACGPRSACVDPNVCLGASGAETCVAPAALGDACDADTPCGPYGQCVTGTCRELVDPSEACDADHVCPSTHECAGGSCVALPGLGEPCPSGTCGAGLCSAGMCVFRGARAGEPCARVLPYCEYGLHCADVGGAPTCIEDC